MAIPLNDRLLSGKHYVGIVESSLQRTVMFAAMSDKLVQ